MLLLLTIYLLLFWLRSLPAQQASRVEAGGCLFLLLYESPAGRADCRDSSDSMPLDDCRVAVLAVGLAGPGLEAHMRAASQANLVELVGALRARGACAPHFYTLNSAALLPALNAAGFRPLKHRQL